MAAAQRGTPKAEEALARLCETYWYPLYVFIRRQGHTSVEAEDLAQEFFARLLDKNYLKDIQIEGGRFRSYLLTTLKHFLANERNRELAQKRGGGKVPISIDNQTAEARYRFEPIDKVTPESLFERRWAMTLLDQVLVRLQAEYAAGGKTELFVCLQSCLSGAEGLAPYAKIGADLGMSEGAVKVAVYRLRKRYGELLREAIADTVARPEEIDEEIRHLIAVTSRS